MLPFLSAGELGGFGWIGENNGIAQGFHVPALVVQVSLLLSFAVLPEENSHRHSFSVWVCISLILLQVKYRAIVPLPASSFLIVRADCLYDFTGHEVKTTL